MATYTEGAKLDSGKLRYDLIPPEAMDALATILTLGSVKYEARNWEKGIKYGRVFGATMRHLWAWWRGEILDPESGKSHLWHGLCNVAFLIAYEARKMTSFDDRPASNASGASGNSVDSNSGSGDACGYAPGKGSFNTLYYDSNGMVRKETK